MTLREVAPSNIVRGMYPAKEKDETMSKSERADFREAYYTLRVEHARLVDLGRETSKEFADTQSKMAKLHEANPDLADAVEDDYLDDMRMNATLR